MTKAVITESITPRKPRFIGSFDSDAITLTGDVMRLHVYACPSMKDGEKLRVTVKIIELDSFFNQQGKMVDECSNDDVIGEFEGSLNRNGQIFFFSGMCESEIIHMNTHGI